MCQTVKFYGLIPEICPVEFIAITVTVRSVWVGLFIPANTSCVTQCQYKCFTSPGLCHNVTADLGYVHLYLKGLTAD